MLKFWSLPLTGQNIWKKIKIDDKYRLWNYGTYQYMGLIFHSIKKPTHMFLYKIETLSKSYEMHAFATILWGLIVYTDMVDN